MALLRQVGGSTAERELTRAVRRVHERYGRDLTTFFEDAKKAAAERQTEIPDEDHSKDEQPS